MELGKYGIPVTIVARGLSRVDPLLVSSNEEEVQEAGKVVPLHIGPHGANEVAMCTWARQPMKDLCMGVRQLPKEEMCVGVTP